MRLLALAVLGVVAAGGAAAEEDGAFRGHLKPLGEQGPTADPPAELSGGFPTMRKLIETSLGRKPLPHETMDDLHPQLHPVVLRGAALEWPAVEQWTDEWFLREWPDEVLDVEEPKVEDRNVIAEGMKMSDFLARYLDRERYYAIHTVHGPMEAGVTLPREYARGLSALQRPIFWFSSGGTHSVLHRDTTMNINCMVAGRKEWVLYPSNATRFMYEMESHNSPHSAVSVRAVDLDEHPAFAVVAHQLVTAEKGDCVFLPYEHWHQVNSYGRNLAVNLWFNTVPDEFLRPGTPPPADLERIAISAPDFSLLEDNEEGEEADEYELY